MAGDKSGSSFEDTARRVEGEVRRWIASFNDEVVPALRRDGGQALHRAAAKLNQWAETSDNAADKNSPRPPR